MQKFMGEYGNKIDQICEAIPLKKNNKLDGLKSNEGTINQKSIKSGNSTAEDTMKTIRSNFEKTNSNNSTIFDKSLDKTNTLNYSISATPKDLMKMRKEEEIRKQQQMLSQAAR